MPWSEGYDNLLPATDDAQTEIDCGVDHERSRIVAHAHRSGSHASGVLALENVGVTIQNGCWHIGPGNGKLRT